MFLLTVLLIYILQSVSIEAARDGDVRLVDSNLYGQGRVEVFYEGSWGTICHRGWDLDDAEVICRQLGFPNGALRSFYGARFGEGGGRVLLSDVNCVGDENNLLECDNVQNNWAMNDCQHGSDVGVQCSAPNYEGCFQVGHLRAADGVLISEMTTDKCFSLCAPGGYRYFWIHRGTSCDCGNSIDETAQVDNEGCSIECPGNSDQHCGGRDLASVYKAEVDLPYVASPGFPGRFMSSGGALTTRNFDPQGTTGYSFIRFHQFDLPSTATLTLSSNDRTEMIQGGIGINEYWIASTNSPIQISFQLPQENIDSLGFLVEFGEGTYCPTVASVSNGGISTIASVPYTVGTQINVRCNSGYMAYDDTVFCQADGTYNRDIMCVAGGPTISPSTQQPQVTQHPQKTRQPQPTQPAQQSQPMRTNATSEPSSGTTMAVLIAVSVVILVTVVFILACLVRIRMRRRKQDQKILPSRRHKEDSSRNEGVTSPTSVSLQHAAGYETPQTITSDGYDRHIINTAETAILGGYERHILTTGNPRNEHSRYYYVKSDSNNKMGGGYNSELNQTFPYEDVQL